MPEKSGFFDSTADDIRSYPARDFAEYFGRLITNGVFNGGLNLEVTATGTDANVRLSPGDAWISGYAYSVYDQSLVLGIQPATTQDRIDRIILRLDTSTPVRAIRAIVLQGTPNANPIPPALVRSGSIYDLSLAQVRVKANSTIILPANITDERLNTAVCGLVNSLIKVDTATFQREWDQFIADVQQQGFATPDFVNKRVTTGNIAFAIKAADGIFDASFNPKVGPLVLGTTLRVFMIEASTSSPSIRVDGGAVKPIIKTNRQPAKLLQSAVYTLVYDGISSFILQGEGGEVGTAVAADVLTGKTFPGEDGLITGTMQNRGSVGTINLSNHNQEYLIPQGYHNGSGRVKSIYRAREYYSTTFSGVGNGTIQTISPGFTIGSAKVANTYPTTLAVVRDYNGVLRDVGGGNYLGITNITETSFQIQTYTSGGNYTVEVWGT